MPIEIIGIFILIIIGVAANLFFYELFGMSD